MILVLISYGLCSRYILILKKKIQLWRKVGRVGLVKWLPSPIVSKIMPLYLRQASLTTFIGK